MQNKRLNNVNMLPWFVRSVHFCDQVLFESARRNVGYDTSSWWTRVRCPVLVVYGDRDISNGPPEPAIAIIRSGLEAAGNGDVTVRIFRDADHMWSMPSPLKRRRTAAWSPGEAGRI